MKRFILSGALIACSFLSFTQEKKNTRYHLDSDIYAFNISHMGRIKYSPNNLPTDINSGGSFILPGRFDWIMPGDGRYGYSEGTGLVSQFYKSRIPAAGFLELGLGWMFNNTKASVNTAVKDRFITFQYGMGLGLGIRLLYNETDDNGVLFGVVWPEFTSITSIGTRLELIPKFIIHPIYSGKEWGLRTGTEVMAVYRLLGGFSATLRLTRERFRFGDSFTTDTGSFNGKAVASTFQLGFAINID